MQNFSKSALVLIQQLKIQPIAEMMEIMTGVTYRQVGSSLVPDDDSCPFCGHQECFRLEPEENYGHCFSCGVGGDIVNLAAKHYKVGQGEAAKKLYDLVQKQDSELTLEEDIAVSIFGTSAREKKPAPERLSSEEIGRRKLTRSLSPERYCQILEHVVSAGERGLQDDPSAMKHLTKARGHKKETLTMQRVGFIKQYLSKTMLADGLATLDELKAAGFVNAKGNDVIVPGCHIFPHLSEDGTSIVYLSSKDPKKKFHGQQIRTLYADEAPFLGMHTLQRKRVSDPVYIVEGQNDWLSILDHDPYAAVLSTNGNLRDDQLQWMEGNASRFTLVTLFDNDDAGDGYRRKVYESKALGDVLQLVPPGRGRDPDSYLQEQGGDLASLLDHANRWSPATSGALSVPVVPLVRTVPAELVALGRMHHSEVSKADQGLLLASRIRGGAVFVPEQRDGWAIYKDHRWHLNNSDKVYQAGLSVGATWRSLVQCAASHDEQKELMGIVHSVESNAAIKNIMEVASNMPEMRTSIEAFDVNPDLLAVKNGVIDLKTGEFRAGLPTDMVTIYCPVDYDPEATCPVFDRFLDQTLHFADVAEKEAMNTYVRWMMGQALSWRLGRRWIGFIYGPAGSGKSVFMEVMQALLGQYATVLQPATLMAGSRKDADPKNPALAGLRGRRLVTIPEAGDENCFDDELLKALCGADGISVRENYGKPFQLRFGGSLWFGANSRPSSKTSGKAFFERLHIIPFPNSVPKEQRDYGLMDKLKGELSGILNAALAALMAPDGKEMMAAPAPVLRENAAYQEDQDTVALWIDELGIKGDYLNTTTTEAYLNYSHFMRGMGQRALGKTKFLERLEKLGYPKKKASSGRYCVVGLMLHPNMLS